MQINTPPPPQVNISLVRGSGRAGVALSRETIGDQRSSTAVTQAGDADPAVQAPVRRSRTDPAADVKDGKEQEQLQLRREQVEIRQLAARDREVRAHEQAHAAVGGIYAGNPNYQFTKGPNGVRYAHSGHVNIDVGKVPGDPAATLRKMRTVARAALAPAEPSAADRAVAAKANQQAAQATAELARQRIEEIGQLPDSAARSAVEPESVQVSVDILV